MHFGHVFDCSKYGWYWVGAEDYFVNIKEWPYNKFRIPHNAYTAEQAFTSMTNEKLQEGFEQQKSLGIVNSNGLISNGIDEQMMYFVIKWVKNAPQIFLIKLTMHGIITDCNDSRLIGEDYYTTFWYTYSDDD